MKKDVAKAEDLITMDDVIAEYNVQIYRELVTYSCEANKIISQSLSLIMAGKALE